MNHSKAINSFSVYGALCLLYQLYKHGPIGILKIVYKSIVKLFISSIKILPNNPVSKQVSSAIQELRKSMILPVKPIKELPEDPMELPAITKRLQEYLSYDADFVTGQMSGAIYHNIKSVSEASQAAMVMCYASNPLHPEIFKSTRQMESEIVQMVLKLFNGNEDCCGSVSSGGTESILLACKAYRDIAKVRGIEFPEMIVPCSAHAAFMKSCHYFNIKYVEIPCDDKGRVNIKLLKAAINRSTIMLVASAVNWPYGTMDDVELISQLALKHKIYCHVDCCLGSFMLPFMVKLGYNIPPYDFTLPGVTSISCDTHKYGLAPKGSSVVMYSSENIRKYQYYISTEWVGGVYATPLLGGSRPGALISGCWAAMLRLGNRGYMEAVDKIAKNTKKIVNYIERHPSLQLIGIPITSVFAFSMDGYDVFILNDYMTAKNWHLNPLQNPNALHFACTHLTNPDAFIKDLEWSVNEYKKTGKKGIKGGSAAMYIILT
eukprot:NODE_371_length_9954_cov_0.100355.p3 type:complete len:490 gc:universal NODE_371_length_9954_cov_0.100355:8099-6630(-)